ncbi:MAG TPA: hypothetical protein VFE34_05390 [Dongiaceae bacterium]|jgi:hypothetical protein|nr:hypothetical protein [Dongiaceae bacterium]
MRSIFTHVLAALLIVMLAIGAPIPAKAHCPGADGCKSAAAGMADGDCGMKGEPCKVAQNCAAQILKMPAQASVRLSLYQSKVAFSAHVNDDIRSTFVTPEIAPPRA